MLRTGSAGVGLFLSLSLWPALPAQAAPALEWEALHRFRTILDEKTSDTFIARAFRAGQEADTVADLFGVDYEDYAANYDFNVRTPWNSATAQYSADWFQDASRRIKVRVSATSSSSQCEYRIEGAVVGAGACATWTTLPVRLGATRLSWKIDGGAARESELTLKDVKIASIGDSYSSGEGNPHTPWVVTTTTADASGDPGTPAKWWDDRCHRSLISAPALAAARLALDSKHATVTFVSYACSGAEVKEGVNAPYMGREIPEQIRERWIAEHRAPPDGIFPDLNIPSQLSRLARLLCAGAASCATPTQLDALVLGTGGNEVGFGDVLRRALSGQLNRAPTQSEIRKKLKSRFDELRQDFQEMSPVVAKIGARKVLLVTYLDPTKDASGVCRTTFSDPAIWPALNLLGFRISTSASQFIAKNMLFELENMHRDVSRDNGWTFVGDFDRTHGFCAAKTWFRSFQEAWDLQGLIPQSAAAGVRREFPSGVMHPNFYGHLHVAGHIRAKLD